MSQRIRAPTGVLTVRSTAGDARRRSSSLQSTVNWARVSSQTSRLRSDCDERDDGESAVDAWGVVVKERVSDCQTDRCSPRSQFRITIENQLSHDPSEDFVTSKLGNPIHLPSKVSSGSTGPRQRRIHSLRPRENGATHLQALIVIHQEAILNLKRRFWVLGKAGMSEPSWPLDWN